MSVVLKFTRQNGETWREAVERQASKYGLTSECLAAFDVNFRAGIPEDQAAWMALYDADCLDLDLI